MLIVLDHASGTPLYQQIMEQVRAMILTGKLKPGDPLPSIRQLASELVISVITTTRAYQELEAVGLISAQPGRGTYVADISTTARRCLIQAEVAAKLEQAVRQADQVGMELDELNQLLDRQWRQRAKGRSG
ncbi:MAG: GntR family transcriptional regulator [Bacillota bacterium]|nr:GntR family transcriptional regulator [Bacillota bacterium]